MAPTHTPQGRALQRGGCVKPALQQHRCPSAAASGIRGCRRPQSGPSCCLARSAATTTEPAAVASTSYSSDLVEDCSAFNWNRPLRHAGSVVALGKFDALHLGHQALAVQAARMGGHTSQPVLLSFSGMADVLGWPVRLPLVAPPDRARVLCSWAPACGGVAPELRTIPFHLIRQMPPEQFVRLLAEELGAAGVVAGRNYRFGFKAAGDATALQELGAKYGLGVSIVDLLDVASDSSSSASSSSSSSSSDGGRGQGGGAAAPQPARAGAAAANGNGNGAGTSAGGGDGAAFEHRVSSSRVRALLERGDVAGTEQLLGRKYRLVAEVTPGMLHALDAQGRGLRVPACAFANAPPAPGTYQALVGLQPAHDGQLPTALCGSSCQAVELTPEGLRVAQVRRPEPGTPAAPSPFGGGGSLYLLVDFDACG